MEKHKREVPPAVRREMTSLAEAVEEAAAKFDDLPGVGEGLAEVESDCEAARQRCTPAEPPPGGWKKFHAERQKARAAENGDGAQ
jgi:hypothetical protein